MLNKNGTTVLLTTHYLEEAEELCDTIAVINHGQVVARDSKENLMRSFDSKQLVITPQTALSMPPEALGRWSAQMDENKLVLSYQPSKTSLQEILDSVRAAGISIADLTTREASLEDVFLHLTHDKAA
jgi:ABC-2 type transport system ATP-binding protein